MKHLQTWTFRQSWTKDFLLCPERGRLSAFDETFRANDTGSDATTIGTALHEYAELRLRKWDHREAAHAAHEWLEGEIANETFEWKQIKTAKTVIATLDRVIERYRGAVDDMIGRYGYPPENEIERTFNVPLSPDKSIRLSGTWDVRWPDHGVIADHKTGANFDHYVDWQVRRWFVQPTVYCVAAAILDLVDAYDGDEDAALAWFWGDPDARWETKFEFHIVTKATNPDFLMVDAIRNQGHAGWLLEQLEGMRLMHDRMGTDVPWPKNDQHALCSEKWCPAWDTCKGKHL